MDTNFSVAVHILMLASESPSHLNFDQIAVSVGTNPSYIRKVLALLKRAGIVDSRQGGISGRCFPGCSGMWRRLSPMLWQGRL